VEENETERDVRQILEDAGRLIRNVHTSRRCAGGRFDRDLTLGIGVGSGVSASTPDAAPVDGVS
jgi:hypothetical protein